MYTFITSLASYNFVRFHTHLLLMSDVDSERFSGCRSFVDDFPSRCTALKDQGCYSTLE